MQLKPGFKQIPEHKAIPNIGATLDIPTGYWLYGAHGESLLMGGLGPLTAITGPGNMYKSTILHFMMLSAMSRIWISVRTSASTYDSETNIHIGRLKKFALSHPGFAGEDIIASDDWTISDAAQYKGEEWWSALRGYMNTKRKNMKQNLMKTPFIDRDKKFIEEMPITFSEIDSLSAMVFSAGEEIMDKNDVGDSGGSHLFMRVGLAKAQMLHELPALSAAAQHFVLTTAHIGQNNTMGGPGNAPPKKQLQHLDPTMKIKKVAGDFLYLQHNLWQITNCALLWNKDDKTPKYPKIQGEATPEDKDLNIASLLHLRGKAGSSGFRLEIVLSQDEGVLASLTEFVFLKEYGFGFQGNDRTYQLCLMPEETLQRTTVRMKLDNNPKLRRAMNITSELAQMHQYHRGYFGEPGKVKLMSAEELYKGVKDNGYDWDWILENTRGWWTYNNDQVGEYFLSTKDLLGMGQGLYHPYFLDKDKKTVKKEYLRKAK